MTDGVDGEKDTVGDQHLPDFDNLGVCTEHGVMTHAAEGRGFCPLCEIDVEIEVCRGDKISSGEGLPPGRLSQTEIRQRIDAELMAELLPLMAEYIADMDEGKKLWLTVAEVADDSLPMGYSEAQERWANVVGYHFAAREKYITKRHDAKETIKSLKEAGYGSE